MGLWKIVEYERDSTAIKVWSFENYGEAKEFHSRREEFYDSIGMAQTRVQRGLSSQQGGF